MSKTLTPQQNQILELWVRSDLSAAAIAEQFQLTKNTVIGLAGRLQRRIGAACREHTREFFFDKPEITDWSEVPRVTTLYSSPRNKVLQRAGQTSYELAHAKKSKQDDRRREELRLEALARRKRYDQERREKLAREREAWAAEFTAAHSPEPLEHGVRMMELRDRHCRAVIGDDPHHPGGVYCGEQVTKQGWCAAHALVYLTKPYHANGRPATYLSSQLKRAGLVG